MLETPEAAAYATFGFLVSTAADYIIYSRAKAREKTEAANAAANLAKEVKISSLQKEVDYLKENLNRREDENRLLLRQVEYFIIRTERLQLQLQEKEEKE